MKQFNYIITDEMGLHARPAGLLVREAQKFKSEILISTDRKSDNAKKIFGVMSLAAKKGEKITFTITGEDEETAAISLESFLKENL